VVVAYIEVDYMVAVQTLVAVTIVIDYLTVAVAIAMVACS
jgi:hypothetical protein